MNALLLFFLIQAAPQAEPKDLHGDPLPPGAVLRMGTARWRHESLTMSIRYTKDGARMVTGGYDHTIRIWETATGRELARLRGHKDCVNSVTLTPEEDRIVSWGRDGFVRVWSIKDGISRVLFEGLPGILTSVAVSPDAALVACAAEGSFKVIEIETGDVKAQFKALEATITASLFTTDGKSLIAASAEGVVAAWNPRTGDEHWKRQLSTTEIRQLAVAPDSHAIAATAGEKAVVVLAAATGEIDYKLDNWDALPERIAYTPDGAGLAGSAGNQVTLWDLATRKVRWSAKAQPGGVWALSFHPKGKILATGGSIIAFHDAATGARSAPLESHEEWIEQILYTPDGRSLISVSRDATARIWDAKSGRPLHCLNAAVRWGSVSCLMPHGRSLVTSGRDDRIRIWNLESGQLEREFPFQMNQRCGGIAAAKDGRLIFVGSTIVGLDDVDGKPKIHAPRVLTGLGTVDTADALALSADGRTFATGHYEKSLRVWNAETFEETRRLTGHKGQPGMCGFSLALSPDGSLLVAADGDEKVVRLWETATGKEITVFQGHLEPAHSVALSPDGQWLATGSLDGTARLWDLASGRELLRLMDDGIWKWVGSVAFTPDGRHLATGLNGTILVWELRPPGPKAARPFDELWTELASPEADKAFRAMWSLVDGGEPAIKNLVERFAVKVEDPDRIRKLIADLGSDEIEVREKATTDLAAAAGRAEGLMADALKGDLSAEARVRLQRILASLEAPLPRTPELVQRLRALQALERLGATEAIRKLAGSAPFQRLRQEAAAALKRMELR